MPADFDGADELGRRLDGLTGDLDDVRWANSHDLRHRGQQRIRRRAVSGTLAVCLAVGGLALSATGNLPGQQQMLADRLPIAGVPTEDRTPTPSDDETTDGTEGPTEKSSVSSPEGTGEEPTTQQPGSTPPGTTPATTPADPTKGTASPTESPTPTTPESSPTPTETATTSPTPDPTIDPDVLPVPEELPVLTDRTWAIADSGESEGAGLARAVCIDRALDADGAAEAAWRDFVTDAGPQPVTGFAVVGRFDAAEAASGAYESRATGIDGCDWGTSAGQDTVEIDDGSARWWAFETTTEPSEGAEPELEERHVVGLVTRGTAVMYLIWHDTDPVAWTAADGTAMRDALTAAAARLDPFAG